MVDFFLGLLLHGYETDAVCPAEGSTEPSLLLHVTEHEHGTSLPMVDRGDIAEAVAGLALHSASWMPDASDLPVVDPRKLDYNQLSEFPRRLITAGIAQAQMVEDYFDNNPDPNLRDRAGMLMKVEWFTLQKQDVSGDEAFHALYERVASHAQGSREATASLALLAFLFESCDIFNNPPADWSGTVS